MELCKWSLLLGAALALAGCGTPQNVEKAPPPAQSTLAETPPNVPERTVSMALGGEKMGDHFSVLLRAEPAQPKVGKTKFVANVKHHGQPTSGANVELALSMPGMNMGGPTVPLKHTKDGIYVGEAELGMSGDWEAKVKVEQEGHPGEAVYEFRVSD